MKQSAVSSFIIDLFSNLYSFINQAVSGYTNSMDLENNLWLTVVVTVVAVHAAQINQ